MLFLIATRPHDVSRPVYRIIIDTHSFSPLALIVQVGAQCNQFRKCDSVATLVPFVEVQGLTKVPGVSRPAWDPIRQKPPKVP